MSLPDRCVYEQTGNTHCFGEGLHKPVTSKNGTIAIAPYMPPFPASPGMKQTAKDVMVPILKDNEIIKTMQECRGLKNCTFGEFCPIGGSNAANLLCPSRCIANFHLIRAACAVFQLPAHAQSIDHVCDVCPGVYCAAGTVLPVPALRGMFAGLCLERRGNSRIEPQSNAL